MLRLFKNKELKCKTYMQTIYKFDIDENLDLHKQIIQFNDIFKSGFIDVYEFLNIANKHPIKSEDFYDYYEDGPAFPRLSFGYFINLMELNNNYCTYHLDIKMGIKLYLYNKDIIECISKSGFVFCFLNYYEITKAPDGGEIITIDYDRRYNKKYNK